jgi:hypothetical protein
MTAGWMVVLFVLVVSNLGALSNHVVAQSPQQVARYSFQRQPISLIPPGTMFGEQPPEDWSNLISFVKGQLTRGDVEVVTDTVRYYAEIFNLVMLANVEAGNPKTGNSEAGNLEAGNNVEANGKRKFILDDVAVGFSMVIEEKNVIVTTETESQLGAKLSLLGRGVLEGNIGALAKVERVARTPNNLVIDAPASMLWDGEHRDMVVRYYIWVFPENGSVGTLVWLLNPVKNQLQVADPTVQLLPPNMREDRIMHVDKEEFNFIGIPSKDAFALVQIPQGTAFKMTDEMKAIASESDYTPETLAKLTVAIARMLKAGSRNGS